MSVVSAPSPLRKNSSKGNRTVQVTALLKIREYSNRLTEIR
jgi:hypothetical protein